MKRLTNLAFYPIVAFIFLSAFNVSSTKAQCIECETNPKKTGVSSRKSSARVVQRVVREVVYKPVTTYVKTAGLAITTVQPDAVINLESTNLKKKFVRNTKTDSNGILNLENVPPGKYVLTVSLKGFIPEESEVVVKPQQLVTVPVNLSPITHDVSIKTNVATGEVRYAPIRKHDGAQTKDIEGYCMIPIKDGKATIRAQEGNYSLDVRPSDVEYKPVIKEITVSEEAFSQTGDASLKNGIEIKLERTISTEDFNALWLLNEWNLPSNWKIERKRLQINDSGIALLQNNRFRRYKDFQMRSTLRSLDNKSVGFVVRAVDDKNYYLIQITGSAADEPYLLTGYIVKNGKAQELVHHNVKSYASSIKDQKVFNIIITAKGNAFKVSLEDTDTGGTYDIGIIEDKDDTFPIGAVGIGTKDSTRFEVYAFIIKA